MRTLETLIVAASLCHATSAGAQGAFNFDWDAPRECAMRPRVVSRLEYLLGGAPTPTPAMDARARVTQLSAEQWQLELTILQGNDRRVRKLESRTCAGLSDAAALIIALAIDPDSERVRAAVAQGVEAGGAVSESSGAAGPAPGFDDGIAVRPQPNRSVKLPEIPEAGGARSQPARSAEVPIEDVTPRRSPSRYRLYAAGSVDVGLLPGPSFGPTLGGALQLEAWRFELSGTYLFEREAQVPSAPEKGARISAITGQAAACHFLVRSDVKLGPCAGFEAGVLRGNGFGITDPESGTSPWVAGSAGAVVTIPLLADATFVLHGDLLIAPVRSRFVLNPLGEIHRPSAIVARGRAGLDLHFW